ncbi:3644_t:CDS:10, partial [Entrophospora sp. SA101]
SNNSEVEGIEFYENQEPLQIGVMNFNNILCSKHLPPLLIPYIQRQLENDDFEKIFFDDKKERWFNKFIIDIDAEVEQYLDHFQNCRTLDTLHRSINENSIYNNTNINPDIRYAHQFINHIRTMTENEYDIYVCTPLIRFAFLGKNDIRISSGEVSSKSYESLKKLAQLQTRSGPRLDAKAFILSTGVEVLVQENAKNDIYSKRTNDLSKLEYCTKILLSSAFLALPPAAQSEIYKFETYTIQTNELTLKLGVSSYMFEEVICMLELTEITIPQTIEAFPKCIEAIYKVLSWKSRSRRNTNIYHELLSKASSDLKKKKFFPSPRLLNPNYICSINAKTSRKKNTTLPEATVCKYCSEKNGGAQAAALIPGCYTTNKAILCHSHLSNCINFKNAFNNDEISEILSRPNKPKRQKNITNDTSTASSIIQKQPLISGYLRRPMSQKDIPYLENLILRMCVSN